MPDRFDHDLVALDSEDYAVVAGPLPETSRSITAKRFGAADVRPPPEFVNDANEPQADRLRQFLDLLLGLRTQQYAGHPITLSAYDKLVNTQSARLTRSVERAGIGLPGEICYHSPTEIWT